MRRSRPQLTRSLVVLLALIAGSGCARDPVGDIRSLHEEGRYEASLEPLEELLEARPEDPELQYLYGIANLRTGRVSLALWPLREAQREPRVGRTARARRWRLPRSQAGGRGGRDRGRDARARDEAGSSRDVERCAPRRTCARAASRKPCATSDRLEALDPDDEDAVVMRLQCLIGIGPARRCRDAVQGARSATSDPDFPGPSDEHYCAARASFAKEKDDLELAEQRFEECLKAFPESPLVVREAVAFFDETKRPDALDRDPARGARAGPDGRGDPRDAGDAPSRARPGRRRRKRCCWREPSSTAPRPTRRGEGWPATTSRSAIMRRRSRPGSRC